MKTVIIAEIGSTHDASFDKALACIEEAAEAGADVAKFQFWSNARKLSERRNADKYRKMYEHYAVPSAWLEPLAKHCDNAHVGFACSTYLQEDIEVVAPLVRFFKVASFECTDFDFIGAHFKHKKEILVSTGMTTGQEVKKLFAFGPRLTLLHCVSCYPCSLEDANLGALDLLKRNSDRYGYSDHTTSTLTGALAVAAGAVILEKHFRLRDTHWENPDWQTALPPNRFKDYCDNVRAAEKMMGDGVKLPRKCETEMIHYRVKP